MAKTTTQLAGGALSQSSTRAVSPSSSRDFPLRSGAQSRTIDQAALAHERQRLGGFDDLRRLRAFERRFIELLQSRGQQGALQRLYRFALEVLLRPG